MLIAVNAIESLERDEGGTDVKLKRNRGGWLVKESFEEIQELLWSCIIKKGGDK